MAKEVKTPDAEEVKATAAAPDAEDPKTNGDPPENKAATEEAASPYRDVPTYVYAGPSLPGGLLKCNTILRGTLEEIEVYHREIFASYPEIDYVAIERLIIPVSKLAKTRQDIDSKQGLTYKRFSDIEAMLLEARKKLADKNGGAK